MSEDSAAMDGKLWNLLDYLDEMRSPVKLKELSERLGLSLEEINNLANVMDTLCYDYVIETVNGEECMVNKSEEGFAKKAYVEFLEDSEVISDLVILKNSYPEEFQNIEKILEGINSKRLIHFSSQDLDLEVFPYKFLFLEKTISFIGEDIRNKTLGHWKLGKVEHLAVLRSMDYVPNFSSMEVDDFIHSIRAVSDSAVRLILKIKKGENLKVVPDYYYLEDPFVTSNFEGDLIWAATLEWGPDIFESLWNVRESVDIMDPLHLKKKFLSYCQKRLENEIKNLKKVS